MRTRRIRLALALVALVSPLSRAGAQSDVCQDMMKPPPVGSWAEYRSTEGSLRLSLVGKETRDGEELYWFEMQVTGAERMIIKMLLPGGPGSAADVKEVVIKAGNMPAMVVPPHALGRMGEEMATPQQRLAEECRKSERVGPETITVPMGTFTTVHYRHPKGQAWISESTPFHLVKSVDAAGREMVLVAVGSGATSVITETPMKMPGM